MNPEYFALFPWSAIYTHDEFAGAIGTRYDVNDINRVMSTKTSIIILLDL